MRYSIVTSILLLSFFSFKFSLAQTICEGSLGTNIFIEGNFGSGSSNILGFDPNIAPGYTYTQQMPPADGFYTITNNSGGWPSIYPTWIRTRDASTDPNGYYMVVNASFNPGVFYEQEITDLCENTSYEFSADIINMIQTGVADHILPNVAFFLNGVEQFNTGDIPQTNSWITFGFSFTTEPGMTNLNLTLRNNAPGGIGNDLGLDNIRFRACGPLAFIEPTERTELCKNTPTIELKAIIEEEQLVFSELQWQLSTDLGMNWLNINGANEMNLVHNSNVVGTYLYRYLLSTSKENLLNSKCRIQSDISEIVVLPEVFEVSDTICEGNALIIDGQTLEKAGEYILNLTSQAGCDSIVYLSLKTVVDLIEDAEFIKRDPICFGESTGRIELLDYIDHRLPYQVTMNGAPVEIMEESFHFSLINNLPSGQYQFVFEDKYGCQSTENIILNDPPKFIVTAGPDLNLVLGETANLNAFANQAYNEIRWSPEIGLSCFDCPDPDLLAIRDQIYTFSATNLQGCEASDSFQLRVDSHRSVYVPNAFSPNADGFNDYFQFYSIGKSVSAIKQWIVFDRWGTPVFDYNALILTNPKVGWDGKFNGKIVDPGVYVYFMELEFLDGQTESFKGALTLIH